MTPGKAIKSPCIKVCAIDGATGYCLGCGRTLNEIGNWIRMDDGQRDAVIGKLAARLELLDNTGRR